MNNDELVKELALADQRQAKLDELYQKLSDEDVKSMVGTLHVMQQPNQTSANLMIAAIVWQFMAESGLRKAMAGGAK